MSAFAVCDEERRASWAKMPPNLDLLVTHSPPKGVLDRIFAGMTVGCMLLRERLAELSQSGEAPRFHVFGHIHESRGVQDGAPGFCPGTTFVNAASVNLRYNIRPTPALVFDL